MLHHKKKKVPKLSISCSNTTTSEALLESRTSQAPFEQLSSSSYTPPIAPPLAFIDGPAQCDKPFSCRYNGAQGTL